MLIVPAIDIRGGKCVRLVQGDYDRETVFGDDPAAMARRWVREGARAIHLVDLDGAKSGNSDNRVAVESILEAVGDEASQCGVADSIAVDLGGGIRDEAGIDRWLAAGLDHVILGTAAVENPELVCAAAAKHPGRVWVGIDARDGRVAVAGWTEDSGVAAEDLARNVQDRGAAGIVYTDIDRDGTGQGVNVESTVALAAALSIPVHASGGVHSVGDVERLRPAESAGVTGVIVGRALYDGTVTLAQLVAAGS